MQMKPTPAVLIINDSPLFHDSLLCSDPFTSVTALSEPIRKKTQPHFQHHIQ